MRKMLQRKFKKGVPMIINALKKGYSNITEERDAQEILKVGSFRAGNAGFVEHDTPIESCPRLALLRFKGKNKSISFEEHLNVTTGVLHEHHVTDLLVANEDVSKIEVWEEVPQVSPKIEVISQSLEIDLNGIIVLGRPDRVITLNGKRIGLELKSVISSNTAFKIASGFPSLQYLAQILTYQYKLNIPFYFLFGQYFIADKFIQKKFVKRQPQFLVFEVTPLSDTQTEIRRLDGSNEVKVVNFGINHVKDFYQMCKETDESAVFPKVPIWDTYNKCDYCPMKDACDSYNSGVISKQDWIDLCV